MAKTYYLEDSGEGAIKFADSQPVGFTEIIDHDELKALHMERYRCAYKDGKEFYNGFRTDLYLGILDQTHTTAEAFAVEQHLKDLADLIMGGNWLTAQNLSTGLALSGIYDQALKDSLQSGIDSYVAENY